MGDEDVCSGKRQVMSNTVRENRFKLGSFYNGTPVWVVLEVSGCLDLGIPGLPLAGVAASCGSATCCWSKIDVPP
jgi:hypothetical protein